MVLSGDLDGFVLKLKPMQVKNFKLIFWIIFFRTRLKQKTSRPQVISAGSLELKGPPELLQCAQWENSRVRCPIGRRVRAHTEPFNYSMNS